MKRGLFINQKKADCSIYESGKMVYDILKQENSDYTLDYLEIDPNFRCLSYKLRYDFYVVNWHPATLRIPEFLIRKLVGVKIAVVVEVSLTDCLPVTPKCFDAYMVLDPTKTKSGNIYPFSRPLEVVDDLKPLLSNDKITIGGFGLICPEGASLRYKRFEEVVLNANKIKNCIVRFNFPTGTFAGTTIEKIKKYSDDLKRLANPDVDVRITHDYMSKPNLIKWCSENNANAFPYYRDGICGLSAVTDQAISAGRGIIITGCETFRHLHPYISYYPKQSYEKLITSTIPGVLKMKEEWSPNSFRARFAEMLHEKRLI